MSIGASKLYDRKQIVMTLDHECSEQIREESHQIPAKSKSSPRNKALTFILPEEAGHQIMVEEGYAWPGSLVVASDSHSNMYGGIGCLARLWSEQMQRVSGQLAGRGGRSHLWQTSPSPARCQRE
jgi:homoaconitate hydratase